MKTTLPEFAAPDLRFDGPAADLNFDAQAEQKPRRPGKRPPAADELGISRRLRLVTREKRQNRDLLQTTEALEHVIAMPKPGEALHLVCPGSYTGFDLIAACQKLLARPVALTIASLSTNLDLTHRMIEMLDAGTLTSIALVLAEFYAKTSAEQFNLIRDRLRTRGQKCIACRVHAKISLLAAENPPARIVLEGSGNVRSCNAVEQVTIFDDSSLFDFHHKWIHQLIESSPT